MRSRARSRSCRSSRLAGDDRPGLQRRAARARAGYTWSVSTGGAAPPLRSPRIAAKVPEVLAYAGLTGFALLVSPDGDVGSFSGDPPSVAVDSIAFLVSSRNWTYDGDEVVSLAHPGCASVHAAQVSIGWVLCVVSMHCVPSGAVVDRLRRARDVLALGFTSEGTPAGGGGGPIPAEVAVFAPSTLRRRA